MNRTVASLLFLLVVQLVLVGALYWQGERAVSQHTRLLEPSTALGVDEIRITDDQDGEVVLRQSRGRWLLPDLQDLPADQQRVHRLLDTLSHQPQGFPVASSAAARQRYRVTSYQHHRRLAFYHGDDLLETIYLGRSPAYRRVYARNRRDHDIYNLRYSEHDAPVSADAWLDRRLLQSTPGRIDMDGLVLERNTGGQWHTATGGKPDEQQLARLLQLLQELRITGLADEDSQRSLAEDGSVQRSFRLQQDGQHHRLELLAFEGRLYAHDSRYALFFALDPRQYLALLQFDPGSLSGLPEKGSGAGEAAPAGR
ncbi:DUF4340 domain-containing protein [Parahaliea mediterranea]|uniref:DUF4340 domain-containing protein n=1 Tax=Parahaliea mediterranea TaxID=651086 RepID=UPI00130057B3|nr:DUF4340 domain-containing protein [Parahaliea mediterranea]